MLNKHPVDIYNEISEKHPEWLDWEPETLIITLELRGKEVEQDKVLAVQTVAKNPNIIRSNSFIFEKVVISFCNGFAIMDAYTKPYVEEVVYAVKQIKKILTASQDIPEEDVLFHGSVPGYLSALAHLRGWVVLPGVLDWAQESLNFLTGMGEGTAKYKEHYTAMSSMHKAALSVPDLGDSEYNLTSRYVGAHLYDPTA